MGDRVQKELEAMVPELQDLKSRKLFSDEEIRKVVKKRTDFEYALQRRIPVLTDYLRYLQYEMNLDLLRRKRIHRLNQHLRKTSVSDYAAVQRVYVIFTRALKKFSNDINLWLQFLDWAIAIGASKRIELVFPKALALHPLVPALWIKAALYQFNITGNIDAARVYFQRGLRLNPGSKELWLEFFRMEMKFLGRIAKRKAVLGFVPTMEQLADYKTRAANGFVETDEMQTFSKSKPFDPSDLIPLTPPDHALLSGIIPSTIFKNACKELALAKDLSFRLSFLPLVSEWCSGTEPKTLIQAMSNKAVHAKGYTEPKEHLVNLDVECLLVAGVNIEGIYDTILDACKDDFERETQFWNAYARSALILYNPVLPTSLEEQLQEVRVKRARMKAEDVGSDSDDDVKEEDELVGVSKYLVKHASQPISALLAFAGPEAVAVARYEEGLAATEDMNLYLAFLSFLRERMAEYASMTGPEPMRVSRAYKAAVIETCRRAAALGKASPAIFDAWIVTLQQARAHTAADTLEVPTPVSSPVLLIKPAVVAPADATSISAVLAAAVEANAANGATMGVDGDEVLALWRSIISLFVSRHARAILTGDEDDVTAATETVLKCYRTAIASVSLQYSTTLWENLLLFHATQTVATCITDSDAILEAREATAELYKQALQFYVSARPDIDVAAYSRLIADENAASTMDYALHAQNQQQQQGLQVANEALDRIKQSYLSWALAVAATPTSAADKEAKTSSATLLGDTIDTVLFAKHAPHSLYVYLSCLDAEVATQRLLMEARVSVSQPGRRLKATFERAINDFGSSSVELWMKYLQFLVPAPSTSSTFSDPSLAALASNSELLKDHKNPVVDDIAAIHWRALKTLQPGLRGIFTSQYEKLVHKYD